MGSRTGVATSALLSDIFPAGPLAHQVEQGTFNPKVPGSSPGRPTLKVQFRVGVPTDARVALRGMTTP